MKFLKSLPILLSLFSNVYMFFLDNICRIRFTFLEPEFSVLVLSLPLFFFSFLLWYYSDRLNNYVKFFTTFFLGATVGTAHGLLLKLESLKALKLDSCTFGFIEIIRKYNPQELYDYCVKLLTDNYIDLVESKLVLFEISHNSKTFADVKFYVEQYLESLKVVKVELEFSLIGSLIDYVYAFPVEHPYLFCLLGALVSIFIYKRVEFILYEKVSKNVTNQIEELKNFLLKNQKLEDLDFSDKLLDDFFIKIKQKNPNLLMDEVFLGKLKEYFSLGENFSGIEIKTKIKLLEEALDQQNLQNYVTKNTLENFYTKGQSDQRLEEWRLITNETLEQHKFANNKVAAAVQTIQKNSTLMQNNLGRTQENLKSVGVAVQDINDRLKYIEKGLEIPPSTPSVSQFPYIDRFNRFLASIWQS